MRKKIKIPIRNSYDYIRIMNGSFELTDKEALVLSKFVDKYNQLKINPFSTQIKRLIADELDMDDYKIMNV